MQRELDFSVFKHDKVSTDRDDESYKHLSEVFKEINQMEIEQKYNLDFQSDEALRTENERLRGKIAELTRKVTELEAVESSHSGSSIRFIG